MAEKGSGEGYEHVHSTKCQTTLRAYTDGKTDIYKQKNHYSRTY